MKLDAIRISSEPPIHCFEATGLSTLVVIAGPNGVGKTRLMNAILNTLRSPSGSPQSKSLVLSATCDRERQEWGTGTLDTKVPDQASLLTRTLQRRQRRGSWKSSAFHFDSTRQFSQIKALQWSWNFDDPNEEEIGWEFSFSPFHNRFNDTIHSIYRMLGHHRSAIAKKAIELQKSGKQLMDLDFPDPLAPFREAFSLLLSPKALVDIDINNPAIKYTQDGVTLGIDSLSSGEKEAFNIVFDLLLRKPEDCIIFFDEPELHLHPELSFRLLKTLQVVGARNQFVLMTHSADIISGALGHSVVFVAPKGTRSNQAVSVESSDDTVIALRELGQGLGVVSLGRRIVLVEGVDSSADRETYGALIQGRFPSLVLAPSGSRGTILSFGQIVEDVLNKTLWGVEFFMLADRDSSLPEAYLAELEAKSGGRLRFLPRLHVENYYLDENTMAHAFEDLCPADDWRRSPDAIRARLMSLARASIPVAVNRSLGTHVRSLIGEVEVAAKGIAELEQAGLEAAVARSAQAELGRITGYLSESTMRTEANRRWSELEESLRDGDKWKSVFPGKMLFGKFAGASGLKVGMLRAKYLAAARKNGYSAFGEVLGILDKWK